MTPEQMSLAEARAERARLLRFPALSTADWQRVQRLERRFREAKARMLRFRQRATPVDPPPSGAPAQMKRAA